MSPQAEQKRRVRRRIMAADIEPRWARSVAARIKLDKGLSGCGRWLGPRTGYSIDARHDGRPSFYGMSVAKVAWIMRNREPWPEGHHAAHLCRNRDCVNPLHVLPMTPEDHYEYDRNHETHDWMDNGEAEEATPPSSRPLGGGSDIYGEAGPLPVPY